MDGLRIKCPNCGITLGMKAAPQDIDKMITCPNCKVKNKFRDYRPVVAKPVSDDTPIGGPVVKDAVGGLLDMTTGKSYSLHEGINLIGRMTYKSPPKADVPIVTEDMGLSRAHLYIQVLKGCDGHYHHYAYNASNANPTFLNDVLLEEGDKVGLKSGDKIQSSETVLRFEGSIIDDNTPL